MNSVERIETAFRKGTPDRVPVVFRLGLRFLKNELLESPPAFSKLYDAWIENPVETIVKTQEDLGLDPIIVTASLHPGEWEVWPRRLMSWSEEAMETWRERTEVVEVETDARTLRVSIDTPRRPLSYMYRIDDNGVWPLEPLIKNPEDLELLAYRPDPMLLNLDPLKSMVAKARGRAFFRHAVPGVWDEAAELRGLVELSVDTFERPQWVRELLDIIKEQKIKHIKRIAESGVNSIAYIQDWVGLGLSPKFYNEFILQDDREMMEVAHSMGLLVTYHNCGKGSRFLEQMVDSGTDALETITSVAASGDFDLADVKKRVGENVCLFGGFNERLLTSEDPMIVKDEVKRCLDAAAGSGAYIIHGCGQVFEARPRNIEIVTETVREHGRYNLSALRTSQ